VVKSRIHQGGFPPANLQLISYHLEDLVEMPPKVGGFITPNHNFIALFNMMNKKH
jgi:hypothetical protein